MVLVDNKNEIIFSQICIALKAKLEEMQTKNISVDYNMYKKTVKDVLKNTALKQMNISTTDSTKRNVRETYLYRSYLDSVYSMYEKINPITAFQAIEMKAINEYRGGCTNTLNSETRETFLALKQCKADLEEKDIKIAQAKEASERSRLEKEKEKYIKEFDEKMKSRRKREKDEPFGDPEPRNRNETPKDMIQLTQNISKKELSAYINALTAIIKNGKETTKYVYVPVEKVVERTVIKEVPYIKWKETEQQPKAPIVQPKKRTLDINFNGTTNLYSLKVGNNKYSIVPKYTRKDVKDFRRVLREKYNISNQTNVKYKPEEICDISIFYLLRGYDKKFNTSFSEKYIKEVEQACILPKEKRDESSFKIEYDLNGMRKNRSLVRRLGLRKARIRKFAQLNGQDGIELGVYKKDIRERFRRKTITGVKEFYTLKDYKKMDSVEKLHEEESR